MLIKTFGAWRGFAYQMRFIVLSILWHLSALCGFLAIVESQPPTPAPVESGQIAEQQTRAGNSDSSGNRDATQPKIISVQTPESKPDNGPHKNQRDEHDAKSTAEWWSWFNATIVAFFTFVLVVVGILQWWAMHKQAKYMRDGLSSAQLTAEAAKQSADAAIQSTIQTDAIIEQMRLEKRAWVGVFGGFMVEELTLNAIPHAIVILKNTGGTPAFIYEEDGFWELVSPGVAIDRFRLVANRKTKLAIAPGADIKMIVRDGITIDQSVVDEIKKPTPSFNLVAIIKLEYMDIWDRPHLTKCGLLYNRKTHSLDIDQSQAQVMT